MNINDIKNIIEPIQKELNDLKKENIELRRRVDRLERIVT
jgi:hypothetical protein